MLRRLTLVACCLLPFTWAIASPPPLVARDSAGALAATLTVNPITLDDLGKGTALFKGMRVTHAWTLRASDRRFGGFSGLLVNAEGLTLLSDSGRIAHLPFPILAGNHPVALSDLPGACAMTPANKRPDSEAIARTPDGTGIRIALETANLLCTYARDRPDEARLVSIEAMAHWPRNQGAEAMATLPGKAMVIFGALPLGEDGARPLLWYEGDAADSGTKLVSMRYLPPMGYTAADAAFLPDGRLLVLNRRYALRSGYSSILTVIPPFEPHEGATATGRQLATIAGKPIGANHEGLAVQPGPDGTVIWMISDNNQFPGRKTMLVRLEMNE